MELIFFRLTHSIFVEHSYPGHFAPASKWDIRFVNESWRNECKTPLQQMESVGNVADI